MLPKLSASEFPSYPNILYASERQLGVMPHQFEIAAAGEQSFRHESRALTGAIDPCALFPGIANDETARIVSKSLVREQFIRHAIAGGGKNQKASAL